jgi:transposase
MVKNIEQQAILSIHRGRQNFVKARTAQANQMRGLLAEFGIIIPREFIPYPNACHSYWKMQKTACQA